MNPEETHSSAYRPGSGMLPRPVEPGHLKGKQADDRAAFPPLGATLSSYTPQAYDAPDRSAITNQPLKKHVGWKKIIARTLLTLLIVVLLGGGYVGAKVLINANKTLKGNLFGLLQTTKLQGEDVGRVNILLAGNSSDDVGHDGADLTDSIMIISLDTKDNTAFLLSVPRDLWVNIPDEGYSKINAAYVYGNSDKFSESGYPSGGMGLLEKVVSDDFGININYYALVNYTALRDAVNAVGGITVNIQSSDPRGLYDPSRDYSEPAPAPLVKLTNGEHTLDGEAALDLARARGDAYGSYGFAQSDFTRTANQRLMLEALKDKATTAGVIANPVTVGKLLDSLGNNVQTDFQTNEVQRLVTLVKAIPSSKITSASLNDANGSNLLQSYTSDDGESALIPADGIDDYTDIDAYLQTLMAAPSSPTTTTGSSSANTTSTTNTSSQQ
jgi:LCP family protein required for cell wall assembly